MSDAALPSRREVRTSYLVENTGTVMLIVLVVSLLAHIGLLVFVWNKPMGYMDPSLFDTARAPIRVKRATYDEITGVGGRGGAAQAEAMQQLTAADLSQTLLQETEAPGGDEEFEPELEMRDLDETLPASAATELAVELPAFELPDELLNQLPSEAPGELAYRSSSEAGFGAGTGGSGGGTAGFGSGTGSAAASELLRGTGLITGVPTQRSVLGGALVEQRTDLDVAPVDLPLQGPDIDFAGIALADTTKLDVPEHLDQDFDYLVTRYADPRTPAEPGYFRVDVVARNSLVKLRTMPKDVIFVLDTSSSIPQDWVNEMTQGVVAALRSLNEGDRFNVVLFKENPAFFSTRGPMLASVETVEAAIRFLTEARSDGYTDVNAALAQLMVRDVAKDRVYELVLITDGMPTKGVLDTRELINLITRDNSLSASIYCVGVGRQQNRELLDFLAYRNKGFCVYAERKEAVVTTMRDLMSRLRYPLIKNVRMGVAGRNVSEVYPLDLPNIHQGERFSIFGRYDRNAPFTMQITGTSSGRNVDFTFTRDLAQAPVGAEGLATDWAFWKLHHLYSEIIRQGSRPELLAQIEALRRKYKLKTLY